MTEDTTTETVAVAGQGDAVSTKDEANGRPADGEAAPDLDALELQFKTVRAAGRGLQGHEASAETSIDAVLDLLLPIGRALMSDPTRAETFVRRIATPRTTRDGKTVRRSYKAAARKNIFLPLVKEAFADARKSWHSKYAAALALAAISDPGDATPSAFIRGFKFTTGAGADAKELTGIEACVAYRAELGRDGVGKGEEPERDANRDALSVLGSGMPGAPCVAAVPLAHPATGSGFSLGLLHRGDGCLRLVADLPCDEATLRQHAAAVLADDAVGTFLPASPYRPLIQGIAVLATLLPGRLPAHADPDRDHARMVQFRQEDGRGRVRLVGGYDAPVGPYAAIDVPAVEGLMADRAFQLSPEQQAAFAGCFRGRTWSLGAAPGGSSEDFVLYGRGGDGLAAAVPVSTAVAGAVRFPPTQGGEFVAQYVLPTARLREALAALGAAQGKLPLRLRSRTVDLVVGDDGEVSLRPTVTADTAYPVGTVAGDGAETVQGLRVDLLENWVKVVEGRRVDRTVALVTGWPDREGWQTPQRVLLLVSNVGGFELAFGLPANPQGAEYHGPTFEAYAWDFEHPEVTRAAGL